MLCYFAKRATQFCVGSNPLHVSGPMFIVTHLGSCERPLLGTLTGPTVSLMAE